MNFLELEDLKTEDKAVSETNVEDKVIKHAKNKGIRVDKFSSPGKRSVPDRMFSMDNGFIFFIEFKRPPGRDSKGRKVKAGKVTELQAKDHRERRARGFLVFVVDDVDQGKKIIDQMIRKQKFNGQKYLNVKW